MIADLKPYPAMKDTGVPWLGEVPLAWKVARNGGLFAQRNETGFADLPILEVSLKTGVRVRQFNDHGRKQVMADREKYKRARRRDLAYNMMRLWQGAVGMVPVDGLVSPAYVVACPFPEVESKFFEYLFRTDAYKGEVDKFSHGIVKDRNRLYWEEFKQMPSPVPPPDHQAAIVRYLDHVDRRIRRYVRAKQKLIKLLEEQRQVIVQRAVTRGLDPNVRLKTSAVEWLGDVPEHWEVRHLRQCVSVVGGMTPSMENRRFWDGDIPWVTPKDMKRASVSDSTVRVSTSALRETSLRLINPPAVLMVVRGMILARKVPIAWTTAPVTVNQDMKALIPVPGLNAQFLATLLGAAHDGFVPLIDEAGHGTRRLPTERWRALSVALPPEPEQLAIVRFLEEAAESVVKAIESAGRGIALFREYRTRLIADVVTGKLDVREAAARLPDEPEKAELPEEADMVVEDGDLTDADGEAEVTEAEA